MHLEIGKSAAFRSDTYCPLVPVDRGDAHGFARGVFQASPIAGKHAYLEDGAQQQREEGQAEGKLHRRLPSFSLVWH